MPPGVEAVGRPVLALRTDVVYHFDVGLNWLLKKSISPEPDKNHFEFKLMPSGAYE